MKTNTLQRVAAVDVFRALTMFLMLFVNDIPGLRNVPHWLMHAQADEDMMGFSDTIFPAFLFCMGMSVSFAVQNRYRKGDSTLQVIAHIFWRTVALVAMGLFTMNSAGVEGGLSHPAFNLLMVTGFFLTWGVYPKAEGAKKCLFIGMKTAGVALLAFLVVYKDLHGMPFKVGWWGILGLIGWTYSVSALTYVFTRESLKKNLLVWIAMIVLAVLSHSSLIPEGYGSRVILLPFIPSDWTLHALGMSGVVASLLMQRYADRLHPRRFLTILFALGVAMLALALLSHPLRSGRGHAGTGPAVPPLLDYLKDTSHTHLAVLQPGHVLPPLRLFLLADRCPGQVGLVQPAETGRHGYADVLHRALCLVCPATNGRMVLPCRPGQRNAGTVEIAALLAGHRAADGTAGKGTD